MEILSETENVSNLSEIAFKMHLAWQKLIPHVIEHLGGDKEVKKFAEIITQLEKSSSPSEYRRFASSAVDGVNSLEKHFSK